MTLQMDIETKSGNNYLADIPTKFFTINHPLLSYFFHLDKNGDLNKINYNLPHQLTINAVVYSEKEILYYYNKYLLLKQNGLNSEKDIDRVGFTEITSQQVRWQLSHIKHIMFEVTDSCNLDCKYCGYGELYEGYDKRTNQSLNFNEMIPLAQYLEKQIHSSYNTSFAQEIHIGFYGGEPLLNISFIKDAINYFNAKSTKNVKYVFNMTTNAVLLQKYSDFLVANNFNLLISLDGNKFNHSYRTFHGGQESFDTIFNNLKELKNTHPKYFQNNVNFNAVLHDRNSVKEIHQFIKKEFHKIPQISELTNTGIKSAKQDDFSKMYQTVYTSLKNTNNSNLIKQELFSRLGEIQSSNFFLHQYNDNVFRTPEQLLFKRSDKVEIPPTGTCLPFSRKLFVTVNGKILPCERIGHQFSLGNITSNGLELDLEVIVNKYNNYYKSLIKQCKSCLKKESCSQCLFMIKNIENNPVCDKYVSSKKLSNHISFHLSKFEDHSDTYNRIMEEILIP